MTTTSFDVVILGGGSAAEMAAEHLARGGLSVAVVESAYVGGECPFLACVPSKAILHAATSGRSWRESVEFRDRMTQHRDDSHHEKALRDKGVTVIRGHGVVTGPGQLAVDGTTVGWRDLVVATGAGPAVPAIDGLDKVEFWTSDDALTTDEQPESLVILGGGPIGCELAQAYARLGSEVTLVEVADRVIPNEPDFVGDILTEALRLDGVEVLLGTTVSHVEAVDDGVAVTLDDGDRLTAQRLLVAAGKRPRVSGLGLESLGLEVTDGKPLAVDDHGRAGERVWGAGDVVGLAPWTHGANLLARTVAANILGADRSFDLRAIPRCVFTEPAVMCVGRTETGDGRVTAGADLGHASRAVIEERRPGHVELYADPESGTLVGAAVVGEQADSWGGELVLAIQARVAVRDLAQTVHAFPTYGEVLIPAYEQLMETMEGERP